MEEMSTQIAPPKVIPRLHWFLFWMGCFLLLALAFGAGYLAARQAAPAPIIIEKCSEAG